MDVIIYARWDSRQSRLVIQIHDEPFHSGLYAPLYQI